MREANTGVAGLDVEFSDISHNDFQKQLIDALALGKAAELKINFALPTPQRPLATGTFARTVKILASHELPTGQPAVFPLREESDGSQRLLNLLPALHRLARQGGVFVIDELERGMHPILARKFIEFFIKVSGNRQSQLIFATHESTLLDQDLLRRDEVWFAEKDNHGATQLYSLADFKVRKDLRLEKGYLQGRFGAIPFLGGIDRLIEKEAGAEAGA